jgi:trimethylamine--corrinoid protein Co-methyltransferase
LDKPDLVQKAVAKKEQILAQRAAARLDPETDMAIRSAFNIHLPS